MSSDSVPTDSVTVSQATSAAESGGDENLGAIELEERLVAQQFISKEKTLLEKKHLFQQPKGNDQKTYVLSGGIEKPDRQSVSGATIVNTTAPDNDDFMKLSEKGIHSLTHSVTDELSRPISEVEDEPQFDQTQVSSENCIHGLPLSYRQNVEKDPTKETTIQGSLDVDDFEGSHGEIDSISGGKPQSPHSEELSGGNVSSDGTSTERNEERENQDGEVFEASQEPPDERNEERESEDGEVFEASQEPSDERNEERENEDGEVFEASQEPPDEQQPIEMKLGLLSGEHSAPQLDSEKFSTNQNNLEEKKTDSTDTEVGDAASNLGALSTEPRSPDEECAQKTRVDSDNTLFYPQQLDPEDIINPFSLEVRIRKAREHQNLSLEWEAETIAENRAGISQPQVNLEVTSCSILPDLKETSPDKATGCSVKALENGFHSGVKERTGSVPEDLVDDAKELSEKKPGVGEAVLLGALASGVNRPTWFVTRAVLVALVASLLLLLHVAIKSDSWFILLNVLFLISIAGGLILLLGWYISQIGLVSVEKQLAELNLTSEPQKLESKTL